MLGEKMRTSTHADECRPNLRYHNENACRTVNCSKFGWQRENKKTEIQLCCYGKRKILQHLQFEYVLRFSRTFQVLRGRVSTSKRRMNLTKKWQQTLFFKILRDQIMRQVYTTQPYLEYPDLWMPFGLIFNFWHQEHVAAATALA